MLQFFEKTLDNDSNAAFMMKMSKIGNQTNSQDPQAVNSRVFVGNLNTFQCSKTDVERMFQRYGRLAGISMHKGFAFVQFTNPFDARSACLGEDGRTVLGQILDVNLVAEPKAHQTGRKRQNLTKTGNDWEYYYDSYYASLFSQPRLVPPLKRPRLMLSATTKASKLAPPGPAKGPPSGPLPAAQQKAPGSPTTDSSTIKTYSNPDILICGNCRDMFTELQDLLEHRKTHCKLRFTCKCRTTENSSATNAQLDCEREAKASLLCVQCKDSFQCAWDLMVHVQAAHMLNIYELGVPPKHNNGLEAMNNGKIPSSDLTNGEASAEEMTSSQNCDAKFISTQITSQRSPSSDSLGEPSEKNDASLLHVLTNGES
ncbi:uncharacterized protein [Bemisia tabaci]|uniref:uncharacterized protein isoform X1 n=2 Tax=Bemisia tabaci TaxID=7038 RepID=UPI003B28BC18